MITLDHLIIRARDKQRSATFFASLLGVPIGAPAGPFIPVQVNDALTFDFDDRHHFASGHYAFIVDDATFDHAVAFVTASNVEFGSGRVQGWDRTVDTRPDGRTLYVRDPDGHSYEVITRR